MSFSRFMNSMLIYNACLITQEKMIDKSWLHIKQGKISRWGAGVKPRCTGASHINVHGNYISPGFIDLHIHGQAEKISQYQAQHGTTAFLLSLHAQSFKQLAINMALNNSRFKGAQCLGYHLEGPFINKDMAGAQPRKFIKKPDLPAMKSLIKKIGKQIKIITLAPELKNSSALIKILKKNKIVAALGHTNATIEQTKAAVDQGMAYTTHVFNRMSGVSSRKPGAITQVLLDDRITAEVIADGHHVHKNNLMLLVKNKPKDKIVLVTDSVAAMDDKTLKIIAGAYRMENLALNRTCSGLRYTIAGSNLTMERAVKNMVNLCGVSLPDAVKMASLNPARVIGVDKKKGRIQKGFDADLVIFDNDFKCRMTLVGGRIVYKSSN